MPRTVLQIENAESCLSAVSRDVHRYNGAEAVHLHQSRTRIGAYRKAR